MFKRLLTLPAPGEESFFLWGPRQTGKTTLLRAHYPNERWIDLLKSEQFRRYTSNPEYLRQELAAPASAPARQVVIDEIQKAPALLNEVHWLIENRGVRFALCGSSARKLRRGAANLLGGRALRYQLHGLSAYETGAGFDFDRLLDCGYLPRMLESRQAYRLLDAYIADYLKEEIAAEGLVRNLPAFSGFLNAAALCDGELINFSNIATDCAVSSHTAKSYFEILEDTLLGRWLPAYRRVPRRRVKAAPKFYFSDVGVVNRLARRSPLVRGSVAYGRAFENWVFHELSTWVDYCSTGSELAHWSLSGGAEVDFALDDMRLAVEAKSSARIVSRHLRGLRSLIKDHPRARQRIVVCLEPLPRRTEDGIDILPATEFARRLWSGELADSDLSAPQPSLLRGSRRSRAASED